MRKWLLARSLARLPDHIKFSIVDRKGKRLSFETKYTFQTSGIRNSPYIIFIYNSYFIILSYPKLPWSHDQYPVHYLYYLWVIFVCTVDIWSTSRIFISILNFICYSNTSYIIIEIIKFTSDIKIKAQFVLFIHLFGKKNQLIEFDFFFCNL